MTTMKIGARWTWLRWVGWGSALMLVIAPLVAMRVAPQSGVHWTASDFVLAAVMLGTVGLLVELGMRTARSWPARLGFLVAVATGLLLTWSNLAVGYIGDGDAPINSVFFAIPILALIASLLARGRSSAMTWILACAGAAHAVAGTIGYRQDPVTGGITIVFVGLWLAAAALFRAAARAERQASFGA